MNTPSISCWFVNGSGGTASIGASLHFSNGQYVSVVAKVCSMKNSVNRTSQRGRQRITTLLTIVFILLGDASWAGAASGYTN